MAQQHEEDYEYSFVAPVTLESECPVCLQILQDPHLISCCGHNFCKACISRIQEDRKPCPLCNKMKFTVVANQDLNRALRNSKVYCPHHKLGCKWVDELGKLDQHLNASPQPGRQLEGCQFALIKCIHCKDRVRRCAIEDHYSKCHYYPLPCPNNCNAPGPGIERQNLEHHVKEECPLTVVECVHYADCGVKLPRKDLTQHIKEECSSVLVECDFHYAGCGARLPRNTMKAHMKEKSAIHVSLLASRDQMLAKKLHTTVVLFALVLGVAIYYCVSSQKGHQDLVNSVTQEFSLIRAKFQAVYGDEIAPIDVKMCGFKYYKKESIPWYSTPFYTQLFGYKLCLRVNANGRGNGVSTHISVFTHLMRGEFDSYLRWPFRGNITVQLLSREKHLTRTRSILYTDAADEDVAGPVTVGERAQGWGKIQFAPHTEMDSYIKDDCLTFKVLASN